MDQIFASIAMTSLNVVSKAAFGAVTSAAVKHVSSYVQTRVNSKSKRLDAALQEYLELQKIMEAKMSIITPIIDNISDDNPVMTLVMQLKKDIEELEAYCQAKDDQDEVESKLGRVSLSEQKDDTKTEASKTGYLAASNALDIDVLSERVRKIIDHIDKLVPYLQLFNATIKKDGSKNTEDSKSVGWTMFPAQIFNAVSILSEHPRRKPLVSFKIRLLSLFTSSIRKNAANWTWKEEFPLGALSVCNQEPNQKFELDLIMKELTDDSDVSSDEERYHSDNEEESCEIKFSISCIENMFYVASSDLLKIESNSESTKKLQPCLVMKVTDKIKAPKYYAIEMVHSKQKQNKNFPPTPVKDDNQKEYQKYTLNSFYWLCRLAIHENLTKTSFKSWSDKELIEVLVRNPSK